MTYASGGIIQASDYNGFVASVNAIWGTGTGDSGYGQTSTLSTIAISDTVTAAQWGPLIDRINSMRTHQTGAGTVVLTAPTAGTQINWLSALTNEISGITANRLSSNNATGAQVTASATNGGASWAGSSELQATFAWTSANAMRHFFNGGGQVYITGVNSTISGNSKSADWDIILGNNDNVGAGLVLIKAQTSSKINGDATPAPSSFNSNLGFYDLGTAPSLVLRQYGANALGGYNTNYVDFTARVDVAHPNATSLIFNMKLNDPGADSFNDTVLGTVRLDAYYNPPPATLSNVWLGVTLTPAYVGQT